MVVVVRFRIVRLTAEIQVKVVLVGTLLHRYKMRGLGMLVRRCVVLMLVLMFVRVSMSMLVRMRMHQIAVLVRMLVGMHVIVRMLVHVHVAVLLRMVVIVRHDQPSLSDSLRHAPARATTDG